MKIEAFDPSMSTAVNAIAKVEHGEVGRDENIRNRAMRI